MGGSIAHFFTSGRLGVTFIAASLICLASNAGLFSWYQRC